MVSSRVSCTSCDRRADRDRAVVQHVDATVAAAAAARNCGSIALTRSTTSTVLASGWRCTASTMERSPSYQLAVLVVLDRIDHPGDVAQAHRLAVAGGDDQVAELPRRWRAGSRPRWSGSGARRWTVPTGVLALAARDGVLRPRRRRCRAPPARRDRAGCARRISGCRRSAPARRRRWSTAPARSPAGRSRRAATAASCRCCSASSRIGASAGIDLAVARRRRHLVGQLALRAGDRRLHVGRGGVDVAVEVELEGDRGRALRAGGADRARCRRWSRTA